MSGGLPALQPSEDDVARLLNAKTHIGSTNVNYQMQQYIYKRRSDGVHIINLKQTYEKMLYAARVICTVENPADVFVISSRNYAQRACLKYAHYTGATPIAGRFTPGAFTNQIQAAFREPRLLIVADPMADHQPVNEASYNNLPVIALCNSSASLQFVDIAIPCNNKNHHSLGLMFWMLAREVLRLRGMIPRSLPWEEEVMPDLFFFRSPEEEEKKAIAAKDEKPEVVTEPAILDPTEEVVAPAGVVDPLAAVEQPTAVPQDMSAQTGTAENWGGEASWA